MKENLVTRARKKATQSICRYKVSALGINRRGECVDSAINRPRFMRQGGGIHAEMALMARAKQKGIKTIIICRVNGKGVLMKIDPCKNCREKARELGIEIQTVS